MALPLAVGFREANSDGPIDVSEATTFTKMRGRGGFRGARAAKKLVTAPCTASDGRLLIEEHASLPPPRTPLSPKGSAMIEALVCSLVLLASSDETYLGWIAEPAKLTALPATSGRRLSVEALAALDDAQPKPPFADLFIGIRTSDGDLWAAAPRGVMVLAPGAARWRLFHSRCWLPGDRVQALAITDSGDALVQTPEGIGRIARRKTSLARKMLDVNKTLQDHHVQYGLVGAISLHEPGNPGGGHSQSSNDNDGLWTSLYVAAEAFRYSVTGDEAAKRNARRSLDALMFLERITGIPGFCARSVVPIDEEAQTVHGEWHRSADNRWWWKGDTSSDEVVGHYFAYFIYYNVAATDEEKNEIRPYVQRITDHILDHGLTYVGPPGKPTTWGVWNPEDLNHNLERIGDRGLNSLEILSHLKVAEYIVGKPRYTEMIQELIDTHSYDINTVLQKQIWASEWVNHSDDELAFLSYYPLLLIERDARLREIYLASIRRSWRIERPEHSPLFNFIYGAALQASVWTDPAKRPDAALVDPAEYDRDLCLDWFRDVPADTIVWRVVNSDRQDIGPVATNRFRRSRAQFVLPPSERRVMKWNGDPYALDGGSGGGERDDGTVILLPYWLGRYHRLID